ncbi:uncharacterized protein LOC143083948 isoform X2 [Mytilus galloprovincialis]|uniref:uncharacterized protein LOC143083948 isoform X2 n=1 Tax=Mytilus galloprovincialis TaxID=29158 RepID=UPI003F7BAA56
MVDNMVSFPKYIVEEFKEKTDLWVKSTLQQVIAASTAEEVEYGCRKELVSTIQYPYWDPNCFPLLFPLVFMSNTTALQKIPAVQQLILPPLTFSARPSSLHFGFDAYQAKTYH